MNNNILPAVALRGLVVFPHSSVSFDISRKESLAAVEAAMNGDKTLFLVTQKDPLIEKPSALDLYKTGCIATVRQLAKIPNGISRVMVDVSMRAVRGDIVRERPYLEMTVLPEEEENTEVSSAVSEAYIRSLREAFEKYIIISKHISPDRIAKVFPPLGLSGFADAVAANINCDTDLKQSVLETLDVYDRIELILSILASETEILTAKALIDRKVKEQMDENQREYYLREEMKVIEKELGDKDGFSEEIAELRKKIKELSLSEEDTKKLLKETERLSKMPSVSPDHAVIRNYLDTVLELPWNTTTEENTDINAAREILEADHYGLSEVKKRVLEFLSVHCLTGGADGTVLCLAGPPGTGKTSVASSIARALGRKFVRISLGGIHDEAEIRGHRKTYIGSMPGRIIDAVRRAGSKNPVILLDEIDKLGSDYKGDPSSALLEVLDVEQNHSFRDNFIELPFDLSNVMFIATANNISTIPSPLLDRVELIEVNGYTQDAKFEIAKRYLIPKQAEKNGLKGKKVSVNDDALNDIIEYYTREAGVRELERKIAALMRGIAREIMSGEKKSVRVTKKGVIRYLGKHKFLYDKKNETDEIGTVRGLAWTSAGGDTLSVEVNVMQGTGKVELTGNLGDVMKESAMTAVSYVRSCADELKIDDDFYKTKDIHIHVPEGAVPKDGPSAGITIATAVASALTNTPVKADIAMTGEITLRGKVLPIGGLKEKSLAAYRAGIRTVIIPDENYVDIEDIPESVRDEIKFIPVKKMDTVFKNAFSNQ